MNREGVEPFFTVYLIQWELGVGKSPQDDRAVTKTVNCVWPRDSSLINQCLRLQHLGNSWRPWLGANVNSYPQLESCRCNY